MVERAYATGRSVGKERERWPAGMTTATMAMAMAIYPSQVLVCALLPPPGLLIAWLLLVRVGGGSSRDFIDKCPPPLLGEEGLSLANCGGVQPVACMMPRQVGEAGG